VDINKNEKKAVWMYAAILFFSAFIVLLLTAYSQIKLNRNIMEYEDQINNEKQQNINFKLDLATMVKKNEELNEKIAQLEQEILQLKEQNSKALEDINQLKKRFSSSKDMYENLIFAIEELENDNIINCALILNTKIDASLLDAKGRDMYRYLVDSTYKPASHLLYNQGYQLYLEKDYASAIEKFKTSLELSENEYISDDCLYFIAYSEFRQGNFEKVKEAVNQLLTKYPDSSYKDDAKDLLKMIANG